MTQRDTRELVRFQLFDDVVAYAGDRRVDMGSARERCLLAALLLHNGRRISRIDLANWIWDDAPKNAAGELDKFMTRLRRRLDGVGLAGALVSRDGLCQLDVSAESIDLHRFRARVEQARTADSVNAARLLGEALELTEGAPLAGLQNLRIDGVRHGLVEERYGAELAFVRVELQLGHYKERIAYISRLFADRPHDATVAELAMRAFQLAGRQPDALEVYTRHLAQLDDSGLIVSPSIAELHQRILNQDSTLQPHDPQPTPDDDRAATPVPSTELDRARDAPDPSAEIREALADHHLVVLIGASDDCRATALRLLGDRSRRDGCIVVDVLKTWTRPAVAALPTPRAGFGYLLTLNDITTDRAGAAFAEDLLTYASRLADRGAYLVVTARPELWQECWHAAGHVTLRLARRSGAADPEREHLQLTDPDGRESTFPLWHGIVPCGRLTLGRSVGVDPAPDLVLDSGTSSPVSRRHALLTYEDGEWWLEPTGKNKPRLHRRGENRAAEFRERVRLRDGDVVLIEVRAGEDGGWRGWRLEFRDPQATTTSRGGPQ